MASEGPKHSSPQASSPPFRPPMMPATTPFRPPPPPGPPSGPLHHMFPRPPFARPPFGWPMQYHPIQTPVRPVAPTRPPPRPVASKPIPGTPWLEVTTDTGQTFWHNTETNQGAWSKPKELSKAPPPLDPAKAKMLERAKASGAVIAPQYARLAIEAGPSTSSSPNPRKNNRDEAKASSLAEVEENQDEDVTFTEADIAGPTMPPPLKPPKVLGSPPPPLPPPPPGSGDSLQQQQQQQQRQRQQQQQQQQKAQGAAATEAFKALLSEHGVHAFSRYEREVPKLQNDPRFSALPRQRRRAVFEDYCAEIGRSKKSRVAHGGKETLQQIATPSTRQNSEVEEGFKALLRERVTRPTVHWRDLREFVRQDARFTAITSDEVRKELFYAHIDTLRRVEEARYRAEMRARKELDAAERRRMKASATEAAELFRALLAEMIRDSEASWEDSWPRLRQDPQGRGDNPSLERTVARQLFDERVAELREVATAALYHLLDQHRNEIEGKEWSDVDAMLSPEKSWMAVPQEQRRRAWVRWCAGRKFEDDKDVEGRDRKRAKLEGDSKKVLA